MAQLFSNLNTQNMEQAVDRIGGSFTKESGAYDGLLSIAYVSQSSGGANYLHVEFTLQDGSNYREDLYFTNKEGNPYYEKNGKQFPLPGYTITNDLMVVTAGTTLGDTEFEERVVNVYNPETNKDEPKSVMVPIEAIGQKVTIALIKTLEFKQKKNERTGQYEDIDETRESNSIDKVFDTESRLTVLEAMNNATEAVFYDQWVEANAGKTRDKTKGKTPAKAGTAGAPPKAAGAAGSPERKPLFGKK